MTIEERKVVRIDKHHFSKKEKKTALKALKTLRRQRDQMESLELVFNAIGNFRCIAKTGSINLRIKDWRQAVHSKL